MSEWLTTEAFERTAQKWRVLAERRHAYLVDLYDSGRWTRYYTEAQLVECMRESVRQRDRWAQVAPPPPDAAPAPDIPDQLAAAKVADAADQHAAATELIPAA
jgi:uncharacterized repeat protein (TIGR03809 family)